MATVYNEGVSTIASRDRVIVVGAIVALTMIVAYGSPFSSAVNVTIALVGLTLAYVVGDRMRIRAELDGAPEAEEPE